MFIVADLVSLKILFLTYKNYLVKWASMTRPIDTNVKYHLLKDYPWPMKCEHSHKLFFKLRPTNITQINI